MRIFKPLPQPAADGLPRLLGAALLALLSTGPVLADQPNIPAMFADSDFIEIIERDEGLATRPTGYAPETAEADHVFHIELNEGQVPIGQNVIYDGFLTDGKIPGPTIRVTEGDIVRMEFTNTGNMMHGGSIHAAYTQTSKHIGNIMPGETASVTFRATTPGVFMYHCAPGGHAIPMHVMSGQYGMIIVEPREQTYQLEAELGHGPDVELNIVQHEIYDSGKSAVEGDVSYTAFNGEMFRYINDPIMVRPGDYVRINYLNVGPNELATFHIVGIIWDYVYWQGHPAPEARMPGGQTVTSGPSDSWVIEFRVPPEEGNYLMLDHAVGNTSRGAIGVLIAEADAERSTHVQGDGPSVTEAELAELRASANRIISPFGIPEFSEDQTPAMVDRPVRFGADVDEVVIEIKGNSFYPKVVEVEPGTTITWVNEDVFTYGIGEQSGAHNAVAMSGPTNFGTAMLGHAESASVTLTEPGVYNYICAPHPYMQGRVIVRDPA